MKLSETIRQFVRFGIVGTIGAAVDFGTYGLMTRVLGWDAVWCVGWRGGASYATTLSEIAGCTATHMPLVPANMTSVFLAIASNFFLNKYFTFRDTASTSARIAAQGAGYFTMSVTTWILNQVLTGFFVSRLTPLHAFLPGYADVAAKVLAVFVVLFFNFFGSKFIIFRKTAETR